MMVGFGDLGCGWAKHVPNNVLSSGASHSRNGSRKLLLLCDTSEKAGATTMPLRRNMDLELKQSLAQYNVDLVENAEDATHALIVLTSGMIMAKDGQQRNELCKTLEYVVKKLLPFDIVYAYSKNAGWDFDQKDTRAELASASKYVIKSIHEHEALVYRPLNSPRGYEHTSMVKEILKRLRPKCMTMGGSTVETKVEITVNKMNV